MKTETAVQIISATISEYAATTTARAGKSEATVCIYEDIVMVYKCHPGLKNRIPLGKQFPSMSAAMESYKSPEMKAILAAADKTNA